MDFQPIERPSEAFQQSVTAEQVVAMTRRAFGTHVQVRAAVELGNGTYNNTYSVDLTDVNTGEDPHESPGEPSGANPRRDRSVILRVAPEPARQSRTDHAFLRNEVASIPHLAPIAALMPRLLATDFSQQVVGRDYVFQSLLHGVPAPEGLAAYPRASWAAFYRNLGAITRVVHDVRGERFGPVSGPAFDTWSEAVAAHLDDLAADLDDLGLDATDVRRLAQVAVAHRTVLDRIREPRLLHGDLWTVNVMLTPGAPEPTVCGVFDCHRCSWGDPEADWSILLAGRRPGTERDAFWEAYGPLTNADEARLRRLIYRASHLAAARLERHRLGNHVGVAESYDEMRELLALLPG
ncbi:phosphotransferase family protein [Actinopolymorpha singaporensis]|uniref:Phosphotransferase enzyme family protein n=1 Tax=Actinopolymorpha singaporensis TaxID=117157 RepID=A0A1H1Q0V6_9ACTN|nr:aminoglycoside phosphotransferase family protein [Actinopolymorpha singaporensis]SDS17036.1 Phosphotransferase enzyme family protein [Actinopolymorpha singaporensis]